MKTAFIFPGQGAQKTGMGQDLYDRFDVCRDLFSQASDILGYDMAACCFEGPDEVLTASDKAQPAIFLVSAAALAALKQSCPNIDPVAVAGLSSGEWAALYAAGSVTFEDTLKILEARGTCMQQACNENKGGMLSVMGLNIDALEQICETTGMQIANINSPIQVVLSGPVSALDSAEKAAAEAGAKKAIRLNVAGAFHSRLMEPAAAQFADFLEQVPMTEPAVPVLSNVTGKVHESAEIMKEMMVRQITESVQWVKNVETLLDMGVEQCIECGPGKVLCGLVKRIDKSLSLHNIQESSDIDTVQ